MPTPGMQHYSKREHVSISSLTAASRCLRKFFYGSGVRLRSPGPTSAPLLFGEAIHSAAPLILAGRDGEALEAFDRAWDSDLDDKSHSRTNALKMLVDFKSDHAIGRGLYSIVEPPQGLVDLGSTTAPYEVPWALDIGLPIPLVGRTDWLGKLRDRDMVVPVELKTTAEMSERLFSSFLRNPQVVANILAAREMTGDHSIDRIVMVFMRKSGAKAQAVETKQQIYYASEVDIEDFLGWARYWGSQILACEETGTFPKNVAACTPYPSFGSHGYLCDSHTLCSVPDWTSLLGSYVIGEEKPFVIHKLPVIQGAPA